MICILCTMMKILFISQHYFEAKSSLQHCLMSWLRLRVLSESALLTKQVSPYKKFFSVNFHTNKHTAEQLQSHHFSTSPPPARSLPKDGFSPVHFFIDLILVWVHPLHFLSSCCSSVSPTQYTDTECQARARWLCLHRMMQLSQSTVLLCKK